MEKVLGYPSDDISETPDPTVYYDGNRLDADLIVRNDCVIEAKRMKVPLLAWSRAEDDFSNAIDQGLTYLDNYDTNFCIITNGWDWYLFAKSANWNQFNQGFDINYFGLRFRLDEAASSLDLTRLSQFMSLFNNSSVSGMCNQEAVVMGCTEKLLGRNMYGSTCKIYFRDFSTSPVSGRGSGFNFSIPTVPSETRNPIDRESADRAAELIKAALDGPEPPEPQPMNSSDNPFADAKAAMLRKIRKMMEE